jgi:hypothetical protein
VFTQVKTPQDIFFSPQRLVVPLFQRPYVWSQERQWQPLWDDVRRVAERFDSSGQATSHFLGAIVLQQQPSEIGNLTVRTVIDGQQRLTTLQILFDAIYGVLVQRNYEGLASQMENLVRNQDAYISDQSDRFKVWPTNRDRPAFDEVMATALPDYSKLKHRESRLVRAHQFFLRTVSDWLDEGEPDRRANALVTSVSKHLELVVIDLQAEEDAQEIFETLNARGTPLTAADLIKNFVFQRLQLGDEETERAYHDYWQRFETPFWETEVSVGRILYTRSSLFFTQWLVAMTGEEITEREVFSRFKRFATDESAAIQDLLPRISRTAAVYQEFSEKAGASTGELSRLEMFVYRLGVLNYETVKPFIIWLTDPDRPPIDPDQFDKALDSLESWFVRRMLTKSSSNSYNNTMSALIREVASKDRQLVGEVVEDFLVALSGSNSNTHWPSDSEVLEFLSSQPIYRRISRAKLRMVLEAVEDARRGYGSGAKKTFSEQPVVRGECSLEHVMPQEWLKSWPGDEFVEDGLSRNELVHRLGNLVLVTQALNSKVSNGPWSDKRISLAEHSTLLTTKEVVDGSVEEWDESAILDRTERVAKSIVDLWKVPEGHPGSLGMEEARDSNRVTVADLVSAGFLKPGQTVLSRVQGFRGHEGFIADDGAIFVNGKRFESPSAAAKEVTKKQAHNGWWFWVTDMDSLYSLSDARQEYSDSMGVDVDEDED